MWSQWYSFNQWISPLRRFVNRKMNEIAKKIVSSSTILEVGAGPTSYKKLFPTCSVTTIDLTPGGGVDVVANVEKLDHFPDNSFDVIFCLNVLEHVQNYENALSELQRVLKKNGTLYLYTPFLFPLHDEPSDYWRFSEYAYKTVLLKSFSSFLIERQTLLNVGIFKKFALGVWVECQK